MSKRKPTYCKSDCPAYDKRGYCALLFYQDVRSGKDKCPFTKELLTQSSRLLYNILQIALDTYERRYGK